ncbi:hypothetical protein BKI52_44055 [marine bacterium AO1-C]|nr:hypothetical protein BKI52_44055 [marine bacterium AO1-C]
MNTYTQNYIYDAGTNLLALQHHDGQRNRTQYQPVQANNNRQTQYSYDEAGNQLQNDALDEMVYNADGQLCKTVRTDGDHTITEYYAYLSPGVRSRKVTEIHETQGGKLVELKTVAYVGGVESRANYIGQDMSYDGETVTGDSAKQEWTTTRIKAGDHRLGSINKDKLTDQTTLSFSLSNHIGSASCELDEQGQIIGYESYYPYGGIIETLTGSFQVLGYSGQELDSTQLNYYGHRYYDASTARWNRPDPIRFNSKQLNLYAMVGGNPVTYRDFWGLNQLERVLNAIKEKKLLIVGEHHKHANSAIRKFGKTKVFREHEYYRETETGNKEMGDDPMLTFKHFASLAADPNLYKTSEGIGLLSSYSIELSKLLKQARTYKTITEEQVSQVELFRKKFIGWVEQVENTENINPKAMAKQWKKHYDSIKKPLGKIESSKKLARKRSEHMWKIGKKSVIKEATIWFVGQVHIEDILEIAKKEKPHNGVEIFTKGQWMEALLLKSGKSESYIKNKLKTSNGYSAAANELYNEAINMFRKASESSSQTKAPMTEEEKAQVKVIEDINKTAANLAANADIFFKPPKPPVLEKGNQITLIDANNNEQKGWEVTNVSDKTYTVKKGNDSRDIFSKGFGKTWKL